MLHNGSRYPRVSRTSSQAQGFLKQGKNQQQVKHNQVCRLCVGTKT